MPRLIINLLSLVTKLIPATPPRPAPQLTCGALPTPLLHLLGLVFLLSSAVGAEPLPPLVDVFVGGQDGFPTFRIPAVVRTAHGRLLAFAEARASKHDHAQNQLVQKISPDGGLTWGSLKVIAADGTNALNNPTAVVLRQSGRILVMYQRYAAAFDEGTVIPGYEGEGVCRSFVIHSDDEGLSWSSPLEVTRSVKHPTGATSSASGPGLGLELARGPHPGRILIPFNQGPRGHWQVYAAYSDDGGNTWACGETAPEPAYTGANEVQMVELADGRVFLNARNQAGSHQRRVAVSSDGARTWSPLADDAVLVEPRCQASLIRHAVSADPAMDLLLFSNPASASRRTNGTVRLSRDEGRTWSASRVIYPGSFAYSCLVSLDAKTIGCLFERDDYARISFLRFPLDSLDTNAAVMPSR